MEMETILLEQVALATSISEAFDAFKTSKLQKVVTRGQAAKVKKTLQDSWKKFSTNNNLLREYLDTKHDYIVSKKYSSVKQLVDEFRVLLEEDTYNDEESEDDDEKLKKLQEQLKELQLQNRKLEEENERRRKEDEEREAGGGSGENATGNLTKDLADLLYDIKKNREDEVEPFDDDLLKWLKFKNMFELSVHNKRIPELQKFSILVKKITGPKGKSVLDGVVYDPNNYATAWKLIIKQFHHQAQLVRIELQEFAKMVPMKSGVNKGASLRELFNKTNRLMTNLKSIYSEEADYSANEIMEKGCNAMIIFALENSLDEYMKLQWANTRKNKRNVPDYDELLKFMEQRASNIEYYVQEKKPSEVVVDTKKKTVKSLVVKKYEPKCNLCKGNHYMGDCSKFKNMTIEARWDTLKKDKICARCFKHPYDRQKPCRGKITCEKCKGNHNVLLHRDTTVTRALNVRMTIKSVLSPTAILSVQGLDGKISQWRALLDSGSDVSFITQKACKVLQLPIHPTEIIISGIGGKQQKCFGSVSLQAKATNNSNYSFNLDALVIPEIAQHVPSKQISFEPKILSKLSLADKNFGSDEAVNILLGIPDISQLIQGNNVRISNTITAFNTKLGHVLFGSSNQVKKVGLVKVKPKLMQMEDWNEQMKAFWDIPDEESIDEDKYCENFFNETLIKLPDRYQVGVPFKGLELGDSSAMAQARFWQLRKNLDKSSEKSLLYEQSMEEMINCGHLEKIKFEDAKNFLPHSGVFKPDHLTTKLRVVFDGSAKTSNGRSLNDVMYTGPKLQSDICVVLMRFRQHPFVISADVTRMYRQVNVRPEDALMQCVLWKKPNERLEAYKLNVVVFGLASSPFLAIRCMLQVAIDEGEKFPIARDIIRHNFYVDDVLASFPTVSEASEAVKQLQTALSNRGFPLSKWVSNKSEIIDSVPEASKLQVITKNLNYEGIKTLGFQYNFNLDELYFKVHEDCSSVITKREVLRKIMSFYDPTCLLMPLTFTLKVLMQDIWHEEIDWDQCIPDNLIKRWTQFQSEWPLVANISLKRCVNFNEKSQIIAFSDGSDRGYGSCIYVRNCNNPEKPEIQLLISKSRVGSLKHPTTTPRMELLGAVVMMELLEKVKEAYHLTDNSQIYAFMDSKVVIAQIQVKDPEVKLKKFVANRVKQIQKHMDVSRIFYVHTKSNPSDKITRGLMPKAILNDDLWWHGPEFLKIPVLQLASETYECNEDLRSLTVKVGVSQIVNQDNVLRELIKTSSSWVKMRRIVAYMCRWRSKLRGPIQADEILNSENIIIRSAQQFAFKSEFEKLQSGKIIKKGVLTSFNPIIEQGLIKIGGRLQKSQLSSDSKHNIIIPKYETPEKPIDYDKIGQLAKILILYAHSQTLHGGAQQVQMYLQQRYRIINSKAAIKYILARCIVCRRYNTSSNNQLMGMLPKERVNQAHAFSTISVDYFGPIMIRASFLRSPKTCKTWGCVMICNVTKAIHLELVTELTADSFIAALKRFMGRRNLCRQITSDNGSNFVASNKLLAQELNLVIKQLRDRGFQEDIINFCANQKIQFKFIPAYTPHCGGLHEAAVKSAKRQLMKVGGTKLFTYEELQTLFIQVESMLNSRPLVQTLSSDFHAEIISPGHFLTGRQLNCLPEADLTNHNVVKRWKLIEQQAQHFWKIWSNDFLHDMQQRTKWLYEKENVKLGQIVLLKSEQLPKSQWNLAKVVKLYPDQDGVVRIVDIQRGLKVDKRHVAKLCILPVYSQMLFSDRDIHQMVKDLTNSTKSNHTDQSIIDAVPSITPDVSQVKQADPIVQQKNIKSKVTPLVSVPKVDLNNDHIVTPRRSIRLKNKIAKVLLTMMLCLNIVKGQSLGDDGIIWQYPEFGKTGRSRYTRNNSGTTTTQEPAWSWLNEVTTQTTIQQKPSLGIFEKMQILNLYDEENEEYLASFIPLNTIRGMGSNVVGRNRGNLLKPRTGNIFGPVRAAKDALSKRESVSSSDLTIQNQMLRKTRSPFFASTSQPNIQTGKISKNITEGSLLLTNEEIIVQYFGQMRLTVVTTTNITEDLDRVERVLSSMKDTCSKMDHQKGDLCDTMLQQIILEVAHTKDIMLNYGKASPRRRVKRNHHGAIMSVISWLFLGDDDDFSDIREHELKTDRKLETFRQSHNKLEASEQLLATSFRRMNEKMDQREKEDSYESMHNYANLVYGMCHRLLEAFQKRYIEIDHPIYGERDLQQLEYDSNHVMPEMAKFPSLPFINLLRAAETYIDLTDGRISITYNLPLVYKDEFHAINVHATPNLLNQTILKVPQITIAINDKTQTYFYLTPDIEIVRLNKHIRMAKNSKTLNFNKASTDCIASAILQHEFKPLCEQMRLPDDFTEVKKLSRYQYLFYTSTHNAGYLICNNSRIMLGSNLGIVTLTPGCKLETKYDNINVPLDESINYKMPYIYSLPPESWTQNLTKINIQLSTSSTTEIYFPPTIPDDHSSDLITIEQNSIKYHIIVFWIILITVIVIGIIFCAIKFSSQRKMFSLYVRKKFLRAKHHEHHETDKQTSDEIKNIDLNISDQKVTYGKIQDSTQAIYEDISEARQNHVKMLPSTSGNNLKWPMSLQSHNELTSL